MSTKGQEFLSYRKKSLVNFKITWIVQFYSYRGGRNCVHMQKWHSSSGSPFSISLDLATGHIHTYKYLSCFVGGCKMCSMCLWSSRCLMMRSTCGRTWLWSRHTATLWKMRRTSLPVALTSTKLSSSLILSLWGKEETYGCLLSMGADIMTKLKCWRWVMAWSFFCCDLECWCHLAVIFKVETVHKKK